MLTLKADTVARRFGWRDADPAVHCPLCGDRGKASLLRFWRGPTIDPALATLVQVQAGRDDEFLDLLEPFLKRFSEHSRNFIDGALPSGPSTRTGWICFVRSEGREYGLVGISTYRQYPPEPRWETLILLTPEGRPLDFLHLGCGADVGMCSLLLQKEADEDGTWARIKAVPFGTRTQMECLVRTPEGTGKVGASAEGHRVAIRGGRLVLNAP